MSRDKTPLLAGVIPIFKIFISEWERLKEKRTHLAPFIQPGLNVVCRYYSKMDLLKAYIIAMCMSIS
jgi:hypothetical protein